MQKLLLTSQLMPIFITLASLNNGSSSKDLSVGKAKQLTALRFLCLILPYRNQRLLHRLLEVLTRTLQHSDTNRMTSESLGTLLIDQGSTGIFSIPAKLAVNICKFTRRLSTYNSSQNQKPTRALKCDQFPNPRGPLLFLKPTPSSTTPDIAPMRMDPVVYIVITDFECFV